MNGFLNPALPFYMAANDNIEMQRKFTKLLKQAMGFVDTPNSEWSVDDLSAYFAEIDLVKEYRFPYRVSYFVSNPWDFTSHDDPCVAVQTMIDMEMQFDRWTCFTEREEREGESGVWFHVFFSRDVDAAMFKMVYPSFG